MLGPLPMATEISPAEDGESEGCIQCQKGSKLVLFVTGKCHWGCDYCPLSDNRRETPDMFANERRCNDWDEVIEEGRAMDATGTGITGGDPMLDMEKSLEAVKQLKAAFGPQHHIHLWVRHRTRRAANPDDNSSPPWLLRKPNISAFRLAGRAVRDRADVMPLYKSFFTPASSILPVVQL